MKNNDNTSSDIERGTPVGGTAAVDPPSLPENPSTTRSLAPPADDVDKNLSRKELKSVLSSIFRSFNLTRTSTQQKALVLLCVVGVILDPLFFYIPMINVGSKCMKSDRKLGVIAISLRSLVDFVQWYFYYKKKWNATTATATTADSKETSLGNPYSFSPRNSKAFGLLIEIMCVLPLPQAATLAILIIKGSPRSQQAVTLLKFSVLGQFTVRFFRAFSSFQEATNNSLALLESRFWIGAGFNLLLFVIASHVLGAFWYLLSVGRTMDCWKSVCRRQVGCNIDSLYCGGSTDNKSYLDDYCPIQPASNSSAFDFGIYLSALESNIVGSTRFPLKLGYCFWWGLRNLSSLGQNLTTSAYDWEILFSICISILGLILFSFFIGNMQAFFQYRTNQDLGKMDKVINKQKELWKWEPFQWLPQRLQDEIKICMNDKWLGTTEVNILTMIDALPEDLAKRLKKSILSKLEKMVKLFQALSNVLDMFNCMKPKVFAKGSLVFEKDQPIKHMVFILNGKLKKQIGPVGSMPQYLQVWDFCGEELLRAITRNSQEDQSKENHPPSTVNIEACTKVEAFIVDAGELQTLVNKSEDTIKNIQMSIDEHEPVKKRKRSSRRNLPGKQSEPASKKVVP